MISVTKLIDSCFLSFVLNPPKHDSFLTLLNLRNPFLLYPTVSRLFFHFDHFTDGRTPWTSDQLVARPLSTHRTTQTQNKHIHIPKHQCVVWDSNPGFWLPRE
jgi:hypothetical protein